MWRSQMEVVSCSGCGCAPSAQRATSKHVFRCVPIATSTSHNQAWQKSVFRHAQRSSPGAGWCSAKRRCTVIQASGDAPEATPASMTLDEAYELLGVSKGTTSFDEILAAKNRLAAQSQGRSDVDKDKIVQIEAAYDILFMNSMRRRLAGQGVRESVRFADVARRKPAKQQSALQQRLPVRVGTLPTSTAVPVSALYLALAVWILAQGFSDPMRGVASNDVPGLQLAIALGAAVYLLNDKKSVPRGKAVGITVAGLVAGVLVGAALQSWLRVDIVPLGGFSSPACLVSEFGVLSVWASVALLA